MRPRGAIGLLLVSLSEVGAVMNTNFEMIQHEEAAVKVLEEPWQHLKPMTQEMASRARDLKLSTQRTAMKEWEELDDGVEGEAEQTTFSHDDAPKGKRGFYRVKLLE